MKTWLVATVALATAGLYYIYHYVLFRLDLKRIRELERTEDAPKAQQTSWKLGIDLYKNIIQAVDDKRYLNLEQEMLEKHGDTFTFSMFGRTCIMTRDPENIKAILASQFEEFRLPDLRYKSFLPMLGDGIFTHVYGGGKLGYPWQHSRSILRPQFSKQQIQDLPVLESFVKNLIARIPPGKTIDLQPLFFKLTMDTATDFLFGQSVNSLLNNESSEIQFCADFTRGTEILMLRASLQEMYFLQKDTAELKALSRRIRQFIQPFITKALEQQASGKPTSSESGGKYIFLEEAARAFNDPVRLGSEILNILLAGRDTTASLLSTCFHQLARNKDVWHKLRNEIIDNIGNRTPTYEDIKSLTYLRYVLNETLRLYPVVPSNSRQANITTTLPRGGGPDGKSKVLVTKDMNVLYSVWSLHRTETGVFGQDPHLFNPSRWATIRPGWNYLPFNGGPRICLGQQYALTEASYVIIRILQKFKDIQNSDPNLEFIEDMRLTLSVHGGALVTLYPTD
ncbi:hypothetical protein FQN57_002087 [Myotisia sp. PD_48]|nr:hypothetical protein FQN57_002087 [Myotisia sp. PD_48]